VLTANGSGLTRIKPNTRVDGRPARITFRRVSTRRTLNSYVNCVGSGARQVVMQGRIQGPTSAVRQIRVGAVICGPDFEAGEADVRAMLASVRIAP
jgi:hypothetical protein